MSNFRLIHLSDLHLLDSPDATLLGHSPWENAKRTIEDIEKLQPRADAIVVSGDLSDTGSTASYRLFSTLFASLQAPIYSLPGNHDELANMAEVLGTKNDSTQLVQLGSWNLILLNSKVENQPYGRINATELEQSIVRLENHSTAATIVALHHTPCSPCIESCCQLEQADEFLKTLNRHTTVQLVLAGHTHHAEKRTVESFDVFTAASTFAQVTHPRDHTSFDVNDFFASHRLHCDRIGYSIFDLAADGQYEHQWRWK